MEQVDRIFSPVNSNAINRFNILGLAALIVSSRELKSFSKMLLREDDNDLKPVLNILLEAQQKLNQLILP